MNSDVQSPDLQVAIDGPSASGKSTVSRGVARVLGFAYVDSGALYRAVTWMALRDGIQPADAAAVEAWLPGLDAVPGNQDGEIRFRVNGVDPQGALREARVADQVSEIAAHPAVRAWVVERLRRTIRFGSLVMEGRDIGTVVFPEARYKYFLDADPEERARRRHLEQVDHPQGQALSEVRASLLRRDRRDSTRPAAPLQVAPGAVVINTTGMSIDAVVSRIVRAIRPFAPEP